MYYAISYDLTNIFNLEHYINITNQIKGTQINLRLRNEFWALKNIN